MAGFALAILVCDGQDASSERRTGAKVLHETKPAYTGEAQKNGIAGTVTVSLTVDEHGRALDLRVVKGLGYGLDEEALKAVAKWRFAPATRNGEPVSSAMVVKVDFDLVVAPVLILKNDPEYTKQARDKGLSGTVLLSLIVGADGVPTNIKVIRPLGLGLDEKAVEALSQWRFRPATKNGVPVPVEAQVEVSFRLCENNCGELNQSERGRETFNLAIQQLNGSAGKQPDPNAAFETMQKSAALVYPPAETRLGLFYLKGIGTAVNQAKAAELFDLAAFHHDAEGEFQLGVLYFSGAGVARDREMAFKLFSRAATQDHAAAEYSLGLTYELGAGAEQDPAEALKWYRKSAELGFAQAQEKLGKFYWLGLDGKHDEVAALEWALLAQKNGVESAAADVKTYESAMAAKQVAEAQKRAERFKVRDPKPKK